MLERHIKTFVRKQGESLPTGARRLQREIIESGLVPEVIRVECPIEDTEYDRDIEYAIYKHLEEDQQWAVLGRPALFESVRKQVMDDKKLDAQRAQRASGPKAPKCT